MYNNKSFSVCLTIKENLIVFFALTHTNYFSQMWQDFALSFSLSLSLHHPFVALSQLSLDVFSLHLSTLFNVKQSLTNSS